MGRVLNIFASYMKKQLLHSSLVILNCTDSPYSKNSLYLIFPNSKADPQHLKPNGATGPTWEEMLPFHYCCACILLLAASVHSLLCISVISGCFLHISTVQLEKQDTEIEILNLWGSPTFFFPFQRWSNSFIARESQSKVCWHLVNITVGFFFSFHVLSRCCCFSHWKLWMLNICNRKSPYTLNRLGLTIPLTKLKNQHMQKLWKTGN